MQLTSSGYGGSRSNQAQWEYKGMTDRITGLHLIENFLKNVAGRDYRQEHNDAYYGKPKKTYVEKAQCSKLFSWCNLKDMFGGK
ncbi:unnamed protein product [Allacma fusca]|uniref:Uncharacterized protein n=1 Tax=Allacma fusca TaxID=39272 RepID=A0A8J2PR90_9HEXA|nr:unnamed protein product [Allacma fusca]